MATRSLINVKCTDEKIRSVYVHWDGSTHLPILKKYYNSQEMAESLILLGDLSVLAPRLSPKMGENHSFDNPVKDICVAYCRDRGEPWDDEKPEISFYDTKKVINKITNVTHGFNMFDDLPPVKHGVGYREFNSFSEALKRDMGQEFIYEWDGKWAKRNVY